MTGQGEALAGGGVWGGEGPEGESVAEGDEVILGKAEPADGAHAEALAARNMAEDLRRNQRDAFSDWLMIGSNEGGIGWGIGDGAEQLHRPLTPACGQELQGHRGKELVCRDGGVTRPSAEKARAVSGQAKAIPPRFHKGFSSAECSSNYGIGVKSEFRT